MVGICADVISKDAERFLKWSEHIDRYLRDFIERHEQFCEMDHELSNIDKSIDDLKRVGEDLRSKLLTSYEAGWISWIYDKADFFPYLANACDCIKSLRRFDYEGDMDLHHFNIVCMLVMNHLAAAKSCFVLTLYRIRNGMPL